MLHFQVLKSNISQHRWLEESNPIAENVDEVVLQINAFGFTANNITYANLGEAYKYWYFFSPKGVWGSIPCWGFAEVIDSKNQAIKVGDRFYGYFPMSSHLKVQTNSYNGVNFIDSSAHRAQLPIIYNQYFKSDVDLKSLAREPYTMLFRPLFTTSFLLADYLFENLFFKSNNIIVTSASSKTGLGLGYTLNRFKKLKGVDVNIIGLTSFANVYFVDGVNYFDKVYDYADINQLELEDSIIIDLAGNKKLLKEIDIHLQGHLKHIEAVGLSHSVVDQFDIDLSCKPKVFFAPDQAVKKINKVGKKLFYKELADYSKSFLDTVSKWLKIVSIDSKESWELIYKHGLNGGFNPESGYVVDFKKLLESS